MFADGAIFEIIMLICFGCSWPVTIFKTVKSKTVKGITPVFYYLVLIGYISGAIYILCIFLIHNKYYYSLYTAGLVLLLLQKRKNRSKPCIDIADSKDYLSRLHLYS